MAQRGKFKRYLLILEKLTRQPSMDELLDFLSEQGFDISKRTVQRDLEELNDEFGVQTIYDRGHNVYHLADEQDELDPLKQLLERAQLLELVQVDNNKLPQLRQHIHFEELGRLRGLQHMGPLLRAIQTRYEVKVTYQKFGEKQPSIHRISPHVLKEFRGRWYLLGPSWKYKKPIALGLDRIQKVEVLGTRFARKDEAINAMYGDVIGVDTSPGKAEQVVLHFRPAQAPYVKALPLHASQVVQRDDRQGLTVALHVMPNYELRQMLLGLGDTVKVIKPVHLARSIRAAHKAAAKRYDR